MRLPKGRPPIHPGEILPEEFLKPMGISQYKLAKEVGISYQRVNDVVHARRPVSLDTAFRFARYFGTSAGVWINMQARWDTWRFQQSEKFKAIEKDVEPMEAVG